MNRAPYIPHAWEDVDCMFCGSANKKLYDRFGPALQYTYVICNNCRLVYQSPRPKYDEIFLQAAYGQYFMYNPNYEYKPRELSIFDEEIREFIQYDKQRTSILEVGAAMGAFLKVAGNYYEKITGLEISEAMAEFVRKKLGAEVFIEKFENFNPTEKFSCIHISHVIEHIPNPKEWISKAEELLLPGGILIIAVPNMFSLPRIVKLFLKRAGLRTGKWKDDWRTPDHLFEPTVPGMLYFMKENNFEIIDYYTYSRKNMTAKGWINWLFNRKLHWGSNLRFIVRKWK